ncbi:hypothetical protein HK405_000732, partial [Cladochytrium tenue]
LPASHCCLAGDLVASGVLIGGLAFSTSRPIRPPFEDDALTVAHELRRLVEDVGVERFYLGHGGPLAAGEVLRHAQALSQLAGAS